MLDNLLIHRAKIYRRSARTDRFGQNVNQNPQSHTSEETLIHTYPCRVNRGKGGLTMMERSVDIFEVTWTMYTGAGVDIREDDAVTVVDPQSGTELVTLAKVKVKSAAANMVGTHHLEFELWSQDGPS